MNKPLVGRKIGNSYGVGGRLSDEELARWIADNIRAAP